MVDDLDRGFQNRKGRKNLRFILFIFAMAAIYYICNEYMENFFDISLWDALKSTIS